MGNYSEEILDKMRMSMDKVGLGDSTYLPKTLLTNSPNLCLETSLKEAEDVMFGSLDILFEKTKIDPKDVGILIVNCSVFDPVPSLSCMIVNHYKMNENVLSYNLGGMGCTAGLLAVRLANQLLQLQKKLGFSDLAMEASKISLRRFGNTSSSSIWYILAYAETKGRIKKGDKIWQMAFGSGFKCSSVIWRTIRNVDTNDMKNPWKEESDALIDLDLDINAPAHDYFQPPKST
ncbi:3-ketoacyl-CoA synthase 11-like [Solanum stenotomum]|uniref:3-ketoacyl-CoA synthase 11-like n=1 Tax=Solanum stenotomum TaxID=172797 RepID=UPI0020CFFA99|nr:3-ketoacyl-CoA synthase 11-like [Solanum stenotomum]